MEEENYYSKYINKRIILIFKTDRGQQRHQGLVTGVNKLHLFLDDEISKTSKTLLTENIVSIDEAKI